MAIEAALFPQNSAAFPSFRVLSMISRTHELERFHDLLIERAEVD
jgi:hypothetical protein